MPTFLPVIQVPLPAGVGEYVDVPWTPPNADAFGIRRMVPYARTPHSVGIEVIISNRTVLAETTLDAVARLAERDLRGPILVERGEDVTFRFTRLAGAAGAVVSLHLAGDDAAALATLRGQARLARPVLLVATRDLLSNFVGLVNVKVPNWGTGLVADRIVTSEPEGAQQHTAELRRVNDVAIPAMPLPQLNDTFAPTTFRPFGAIPARDVLTFGVTARGLPNEANAPATGWRFSTIIEAYEG